jgi:hypothetical protein
VFDAGVDCRGNEVSRRHFDAVEILPEVEGLARWLVDERAKMLFKLTLCDGWLNGLPFIRRAE